MHCDAHARVYIAVNLLHSFLSIKLGFESRSRKSTSEWLIRCHRSYFLGVFFFLKPEVKFAATIFFEMEIYLDFFTSLFSKYQFWRKVKNGDQCSSSNNNNHNSSSNNYNNNNVNSKTTTAATNTTSSSSLILKALTKQQLALKLNICYSQN